MNNYFTQRQSRAGRKFPKSTFAKTIGALAFSVALSPLANADWSVQGSQILDPNGEPFVYRGVNLGVLPAAELLPQVYADIAATGANAIRIPVDNLKVAQAEVHVNLCKQHKLVCVFTHTLSAGYVDNGRAYASLYFVDSWYQFVDLLKANEDFVVIDIASAMAGNLAGFDYYKSHYQTATFFMRTLWGLKNQLIISGGNWGQDWGFMMRDNAEAMLSFDPLKNTVLSVHMYEAYRDETSVRSYLEYFTTRNLPIIVGEFGPIKRDRYMEYRNPFTTTDVDVDSIMNVTQDLGVGYLGWNWSGYKDVGTYYAPAGFTALNMVTEFNAQEITPWGDKFINSDSGVKATAQGATHFPEFSSSSSSSSSVNRAPHVEIVYELTTAACGALEGYAYAYAIDPEGDALNFEWDVSQINPVTKTTGIGPSIFINQPAQSQGTVMLTVDDLHGNIVKTSRELVKNPNANTCVSSSIPASSSAPASSSSATVSSSAVSSSSTVTSSSAITSSSTFTSLSSSTSSRVSSSSSRMSHSSSSARSSSSIAAQGNCRYVINSQWDNGFTASIKMTNTGTQPISNWNVSWQYSDGSKITGSWNTTLSGTNPYSAKNVNWNSTIQPGQTVEFGFQGNKPKGAAQIPLVTGGVCQ